MANLKSWILTEAAGEEIEAVVIGEMGWGAFGSDAVPTWDQQRRNIVLDWASAAPMLDYEFDNGFGAPGCNAICAWTKSLVIFVSQYDGATGIESVPRHPIPHEPSMPGG